MSDKLYGLSEADWQLLQQLIGDFKRQIVNQHRRPSPQDPTDRAPDVFVALTPLAGIPPLSYVGTGSNVGGVYPSLGTGSGTGSQVGFLDSPGIANCSIFRILRTNKNVPELRPVGFQEPVYNLATSPIPGKAFVPIKMDAFGSWLVDLYAAAQSAVVELPDPLCTVTQACPSFVTLNLPSGDIGTGTSTSVNVVNHVTVESTCIDLSSGAPTQKCVVDPTGCCASGCAVSAIGKGSATTGALGSNSLSIANVSIKAGSRVVVLTGRNSQTITVTYNGVSLGAPDATVTFNGNLATIHSMKVTSDTVGTVAVTLGGLGSSFGFSVVEVKGLVTNAVDSSNTASGTNTTQPSVALTTLSPCVYIASLCVYDSPNTSPTWASPFASGGQDVTFGSGVRADRATEGFDIAVTIGAYTATISAPNPGNWVMASVGYK